MNRPNAVEIRVQLERQHQHDREEIGRLVERLDGFAVQAVQALATGMQDVADRSAPSMARGTSVAALEEGARKAIEERRESPASSKPHARPGEPLLRAALRGIVADYAGPVTPSDSIVTELEAMDGIALVEADSYGLWAHIQLEAALEVRAAMPDVIELVTDRAESEIIAELVAATRHLADEYPDAPWPHAGDTLVDRT